MTQAGPISPEGFPMQSVCVKKFAAVTIVVLLCSGLSLAQQVRFFPDFNPATSPVSALQMNGTQLAAFNGHTVLRLTPGISVPHSETGTVWFKGQQPLTSGFTVWFQFQIHDAKICCTPGDGLAFVIQNSSFTDGTYGAVGKGVTARGVSGGGLGYAGIPNSLAIEFDTFNNPQGWDPSANHVAVQGCGTKTNGPVHNPGTYTIFRNNNVTSCLVAGGISSNIPHLGVTCGANSCADGVPHDVVIEYTPPAQVGGSGTLMVWIDPTFIAGTHTPVNTAVPAINIPYNIDNSFNTAGLKLASGTSAWVGFTGSQTNQPQQEDILAWEFTPHTPTSIQQVIQGCPATNPNCQPADTVFAYGAHVQKVTYFQGFINNPNNPSDPFLMTVTATPISRSTFYQTRLKGTPFANEQCVVYLGTGNKCMVYSITCQLQSSPNLDVSCPASIPGTCNTVNDPGCITFGAFYYTADSINANNADYLSTDPIGSNNWQSIFFQFLPNAIDSGTTGKKPTPSDFVTTFCVGAGCVPKP
jgi:lectin family protein